MNQSIYLDESGVNEYLHREFGRSLRSKEVIGKVSVTTPSPSGEGVATPLYQAMRISKCLTHMINFLKRIMQVRRSLWLAST